MYVLYRWSFLGPPYRVMQHDGEVARFYTERRALEYIAFRQQDVRLAHTLGFARHAHAGVHFSSLLLTSSTL